MFNFTDPLNLYLKVRVYNFPEDALHRIESAPLCALCKC